MPHDEWMRLINSIPLTLSGDIEQTGNTLHSVLGAVGQLCNAEAVFLWQTLPVSIHASKYILCWRADGRGRRFIRIENELEDIGQLVAARVAGSLVPTDVSTQDHPSLAPFFALLGLPNALLIPIWNTEATPTLWGFMTIGASPKGEDVYLTSVARQIASLLTAAINNDIRDRMHTAITLTYTIADIFIREMTWETQIIDALNTLCKQLNVSRAYGYRFCDADQQVLGVGFEAHLHDNLPTVADSELATLPRDLLELDEHGKRYWCNAPDELPPALAALLHANRVQFYVMIPILWEDQWTGCLVLDDLERPHNPWSEAGISALRTIGDLMMGALAREESRQAREHMVSTLESRNAALQTFNGLVAHDIKAPLRHIKNELGRLTPEKIQEHAASIGYQLDSLENMIKRLEVLSKSHLPHVSKLVELQIAYLDAVMRLHDIITNRGVQVIIPTQWPLVMGQTEWITEVLYNLLLNATQSFPSDHPNPTIIISEAPTSDIDYIQLVICDNSKGIAPERLKKIAKIFASQHPVYDNEGLGLTLVHFLMLQMGGRVGAISNPDHGSAFFLILPNAPLDQRRSYIG